MVLKQHPTVAYEEKLMFYHVLREMVHAIYRRNGVSFFLFVNKRGSRNWTLSNTVFFHLVPFHLFPLRSP